MLGVIADALMVGAFVGVALAAMLPVLGITLAAIGLVIALTVAVPWFIWYSLAYLIALLNKGDTS